jgi:PIN domain nuclease of toxin-antitoxin system
MKKLLLDTHALIWFLRGDSELSTAAEKAMRDAANVKFVSIASLWEIAIKVNLGKIQFDFALKDFAELIAANHFDILPIGFEHTLIVGALPSHHRDPFDRMLIAQASVEGLAIVTRDTHFSDYDVPVLW